MKLAKITRIFISILLFFIIFYYPTGVLAKELAIEEALKLGLENNKQLNETYKSIQQLERNLQKNNALLDWQFNLNADYSYVFGNDDSIRQDLSNNSLGISAGKSFLSGLNIDPQIRITEDRDTSLSIRVTQPLYPGLPTETVKSIYRTEKELIKAANNLTDQEIDRIISWLDSYLNLERMIARQDIYRENLARAEENLEKVLERQKLGATVKSEVLTAELGLENARYSLKESLNQLEDIYYTIAVELGLPLEEELVFTDSNQFINGLRQLVWDYTEDYLTEDTEVLMSLIEENNSQLQALLIEREVLEQELRWLEKEDDPALDLSGDFNTTSEEFTVGLSLSYPLVDGGRFKIELEEKELEFKDNLERYNDLYNQLKQELKQQLDKLELAKMAIKRGELNLARSTYELDIAEEQLDMELIDYLEYQDNWIEAYEAEIEIQALKDQQFLTRLEFVSLINNQDLLAAIMGGL